MLLVLALVGLGQNSIQDDVTSTRTMGQVNGLWWRMNTSPAECMANVCSGLGRYKEGHK
jgi:hypothetical protein